MCTRYALTTPLEALRTAVPFDGGVAYPPRCDIVPGEPIAILRLRPGIEASGRRELALVRWGLVPHWVKNPDAFGTLVNARAETVLDKPSFRAPMRHRRCLVPADGWYAAKGPRSRQTQSFVRPPGGGPLFLAALWDHWLGGEGSELETAAILTAPVTETERHPIPLAPEPAAAWLDVRGTDERAALKLLSHMVEMDWRQTQ